MSKRIEFQFDDALDYQLEAIQSTVDLFSGLSPQAWSEGQLLENLRKVQSENRLDTDVKLMSHNFTIEMETGTGKTYVYLRTMLELYREHGFKKFMIVVPSIPVRTGVEKSIDQLSAHFQRLYGIVLSKHSFAYDSKNLRKMSSGFVESSELSICILNIQAFNKDTNRIRMEDEYGRILWQDITSIHPVILMDEPQKIEGQKGKKSKALEALDDLQPLFVLRYSATHRNLHHQIYRLGSYDAYKKNLVKKIQVKTVNGTISREKAYIKYLSFTENLKARIEIFVRKQGKEIQIGKVDVAENDSLYKLSGGLSQYKNMFVSEQPHRLNPLCIFSNNQLEISLYIGESYQGFDQMQAIRVQIRLAIQNHFDKQISILESGKEIKALTLFFVDSVAHIRNNDKEDRRGDYLSIFDEEYLAFIEKNKKSIQKYKDYFKNYEDVQRMREGYFALDKKMNATEVKRDKKGTGVLVKSQEDIDRAIDLILRKKDELISFDEPLCFIFSHSALREGWDNPNVFSICLLKEGSSEIAKKQEIGRGLRLPVDVDGNRCQDADINELTVIANDSYENFSRMLQADYNNTNSTQGNKLQRIEIKNGDVTGENLSDIKFRKEQKRLQKNIKMKTVYKYNIDTEMFIREVVEEIDRYLKQILIHETVDIRTGSVVFSEIASLEMKQLEEHKVSISSENPMERKGDLEIVNYVMNHTMLPRIVIIRILGGIEKREHLNSIEVLDKVTRKIADKLKKTKRNQVK